MKMCILQFWIKKIFFLTRNIIFFGNTTYQILNILSYALFYDFEFSIHAIILLFRKKYIASEDHL